MKANAHTTALFFAALLAACAAAAETPGPLLLANYYAWYHDGAHPKYPWAGWTRESAQTNALAVAAQRAGEPPVASAAYPLAGLYDSADPQIAAWHVGLAQAAGIDAFLVDWWGTHMGRDINLEKGIFAAAKERGFKLALLDERAQFHNDFAWYKKALTEALLRFKDHPCYLHLEGRPVIYLYQVASTPTLTPQKFAELKTHVEAQTGALYWILDQIAHDHRAQRAGEESRIKRIPEEWLKTEGIDCFAFYSTFSNFRAHQYEELIGKYRYITGLAHAAGKKMMLPVHPGHDNSRFRSDPYIMPHREGETLKDYLKAAKDAGADFIMITSWNEWPETTVIEPAATWKDPFLYLKIIAEFQGKTWDPQTCRMHTDKRPISPR